MDSPTMSIMFISAHQVGMGSYTAEYVFGWKKVIEIIQKVFEKVNIMDQIVSDLTQLLSIWAEQGWMGRGKHTSKCMVSLRFKCKNNIFLKYE